MTQADRNYYQILGVRRDATAVEIEAAFLRAQAAHGVAIDSQGAPPADLLRHAYEVLCDPQRRQVYDQLLNQIDRPLVTNVIASALELPVLDAPQMLYLLVEIRAATDLDRAPMPLNLCIVVDRSTSMQGEGRLARVKKALGLLLDEVASGDTVSLVSFSDRAEVVLPAAPRAAHSQAHEKVAALQASGGTEIYQGLLAGLQQLRLAAGPEVDSQLVLLTDGRTYGDEQQCLDLAATAAAEGVTIHAFGIGSDWDDQFLDALVAPSGGMVEHIASADEIVATLSQRLQGLGQTHAHDIQLDKQNLPPTVELTDVFRLAPVAQPLAATGDQLRIGHIEGRSSLKILLVLIVKPHPITARIKIPLLFTADLPGAGRQSFLETVELAVTTEPTPAAPPAAVVQAAHLLTLFRLNERAWEEAEAGQVKQAVVRMRNLSTRLLQMGAPDLAEQATQEARQLALTGELSPERRKQLKYGTRALTRKAVSSERDE